MAVTLGELLQPQTIVKVISKVSKGKGALSRIFGMQIGGSNIKTVPTRWAQFRIFNHTREPASFRAPGSGPAVIAPNPAGVQNVGMCRVHEKIVLDGEQLGNLSPVVGPNAQIDKNGQDYIQRQKTFLGEKFNNANEVLVAGMIRGALYLSSSGDNWVPYLSSQSGTQITVDWQIPAGNKNQLNMLAAGNIIDVSWDNPSALIINHCLQIRAAMVQLTGMPLKKVLVNSNTWQRIINNTQVRNIGGVVQSPFNSYDYADATDMDGKPLAGMATCRLRAIPWIDWHIIDDVLSIGGTDPVYSTGTGTLTKVVADNVAVFMPPIDNSWVQMWQGGELIAEDFGKPMTMKMGFQAWKSVSIEPTLLSVVGLLNALPVLYSEKSLAPATCIF